MSNQSEPNLKQEFMKDFQQAQKDFPTMGKTKQVGSEKYGYSYLPLEQMLSLVTPVLLKNKISISQVFDYTPTGQTLLVTKLMHQNGHEEVSKLPLFLPPRDLENPKKNETHVWGGSVTYESRYSIKKILGIETDMDFNMEEEEKVQEKKINKGEVIETLREQVKEISNTSDTDKTFGLAKNAILNAKSKEQLTDHQKNIATRFAQGKLTITQKEQLETLIVNKIKVLK